MSTHDDIIETFGEDLKTSNKKVYNRNFVKYFVESDYHGCEVDDLIYKTDD